MQEPCMMKSSKAVRKMMMDEPELTDEYLEQSPNEDEYIPKKSVVNDPATLKRGNRMVKTPPEKVLHATSIVLVAILFCILIEILTFVLVSDAKNRQKSEDTK